jgi:DNA-binding transcriptional MerR regulator
VTEITVVTAVTAGLLPRGHRTGRDGHQSSEAGFSQLAIPCVSPKDIDDGQRTRLRRVGNQRARRSGEDRAKIFTIGDLAREFGISLRALRFYEDRGLLSPRRVGSSRLYDRWITSGLILILKGKRLGFTLTAIRSLLNREERGEGATAKLQLSPKQIDDQIEHLERQKGEIAIAELKAQRLRVLSS